MASVMNANSAVSCVECQRRKQKCNRQFPCNHCSKRGVAHLCRFVSRASNKGEANEGQSKSSSRKRALDSIWSEDTDSAFAGSSRYDDSHGDIDASDALNALGYMPHHHHLVLGNGCNGPKVGRDPVGLDEGSAQSEQLKAAMVAMPGKPYTDCLVDNWLSGANHHYYPLYPPEFRTQYDGWWATSPNKVTPELTSLILRICACSALYIIDGSVKERLESELRTDSWTFANRMHSAAEKLNASLPPGKGGLIQVQQLFLTAFWLKSAERWTEAWHALSAAIRAANEIGLHQDSLSEGMSEFDREMRRRMWGILYMWDFALGSMLSRPLLVNHADCTFVMPTLALEVDPANPDQPSPFCHINLHCRLCLDMAAELTSVSNKVIPVGVAKRLHGVVQKWLRDLPAVYAFEDPDTRWDAEYDWVVFQRCYLQLIGHMCLFDPLKAYVTKNSAKPMSEDEQMLRAAGVEAALGLMNVSWRFFEYLASLGAKFHYAVFCIFDTATVLCSAFVHDDARNLPQRETVLEAIKKGMGMLEQLNSQSRTTANLWRILKGLLANLPLSNIERGLVGGRKRTKASGSSPLAGHMVTSESSSVAGLLNPTSSGLRLVGDKAVNSDYSGSPESVSTSATSPPEVDGGVASEESVDGGQSHQGFEPSSTEGSYLANLQPLLAPDSVPLANQQLVPEMEWQLVSDGMGMTDHLNVFQGMDLMTFDGGMPTVLEYWDWQGLDLGNPGFWHPPQPDM